MPTFNNPSSKLPFRVTGTGNTTGVFHFFGNNIVAAAGGGTVLAGGGISSNGRIATVCFREETGGDGTTCDFKVIDRDQAFVVGTTTYSTIPEENLVVSGSSITLTASASAASLNTPLDTHPTFESSLGIVFNVTTGAGGAWAITGYLTVER